MAEVPYGRCHCGCGGTTKRASQNDLKKGYVKGEPIRYIVGHNRRKSPLEYSIDSATGCWVWQRGTDKLGYGRAHSNGGTELAHRVIYERHRGSIPEGLQLDHLCRNPSCVNPDHLEPVTNAENCRRGVRAKLTREQARAIRAAANVRQAELAELYGVSRSTISGIQTGYRWAAA